MNAFIFVSVVCVGQSCNFAASNKPVDEVRCQEIKQQFLSVKFKKETTLAAAQCMVFEGQEENWKVKI